MYRLLHFETTSTLCLAYLCCYVFLQRQLPVGVDALAVTTDPTLKLVEAKCRLSLSIGRVEGTAMPPEWAASGARLVLPKLDVRFRRAKSEENERLLGQASCQLVLEPLTRPTFVGIDGQKQVPVEKGAFCVSETTDELKNSFRFFLDFPEEAERNDVKLPAGRVFFTSSCWQDDAEFAEAMRERKEFKEELKELKSLLSKLEDNSGYVQKTLRFPSTVLMMERIDLLQAREAQRDACLPKIDESDIIRGPPGIIFSKDGYMAVKRRGGILGMQEKYHFVGIFTISEFLEGESGESYA